jgi:DNA polymerase-4/protein ImuB
MMKILCLLLSHFPLMCEALRNPAVKGRSMVITYGSGSQKLVLDYSQGLDGLQSDMPLQQALAQYGEAELLSADMPYYRSVFAYLLDSLEGISPLVEGTELGRVYIGLDGLQLIYPDDESLINAVFRVVPEIFAPQTGVARNKFLAYLTACRCPPGGWQVLPDDVEPFLRGLPCDVLPISIKSREKLRQFGLHTLGQVAALPPGPLLSQFGTEGKKIHNLARGYDDTPLYPRMMEEVIEESTMLSSVTVSLESILVALEELLGKVFTRISRVGLGVRSLTVWTRTWNAEQWERPVRFKEPAMDIKTVINRIKRVMEEYPQPGPVEEIGLNISRLGYPGGRQNSLFREIRSQDYLMEDIRQLELRLGNPQVYQVKEVEPWSRIPERRYVLAPTSR